MDRELALTRSAVQSAALERFGCKLTPGGTHASRTMMVAEISALLEAMPPESAEADYRAAVLERNVLRKDTQSTRNKSYRHLRELYGLSPQIAIFGVFRALADLDRDSLPHLALLVAWSRDPLLRATTPAVLGAQAGSAVTPDALQAALRNAIPGQYNDLNIGKIGRNTGSSWTQSGHLSGRANKVRTMIVARPAAVTLALALGHVAGAVGVDIFSCPWIKLLDLDPEQARRAAAAAHREALIDMRMIGSIVEIGFPRFSRWLESNK